jgi:hypothetical protein
MGGVTFRDMRPKTVTAALVLGSMVAKTVGSEHIGLKMKKQAM